MKQDVKTIYETVYKQGFLPIFVKDDFDTDNLLEGCRKAGLTAIEYTLRREDANVAIPKIISEYPEFTVLVGSTLDSDEIINMLKQKNPQLLTLGELDKMGIHGFISMFEFSSETIKKYAETHLIIPCAVTHNEAYRMLKDGAHIIKLIGPGISNIKNARNAASHELCPIFTTGGITLDKIPLAIEAGAVCIASGFDLILKGMPNDTSPDQIAAKLVKYVNAVKKARETFYPKMMKKMNSNEDSWLEEVPHYCKI